MPDPLPEAPALPAPPPPKRGLAPLAWVVILGAVALEVTTPYLRTEDAEATQKERSAELIMESQGEIWVGLAQMVPGGKQDPRQQRDVLDTGPPEQRFRFVILTGELVGPAAALEELDRLDKKMDERGVRLNEAQARERDVLRRLYHDYADKDLAAPSVPADDRAFLVEKLGWSGRLALAPAEGPDPAERESVLRPARRAVVAQMAFLGALLFLGVIGLGGLIILVVFLATGGARPRFQAAGDGGALYAEAFALWMLLFLVLRYAMGFAVDHNLIPAAVPRLLLNLGPELLITALALAWPVLRGLPWRQVRQDVGLTFGRRPWLEPLLGVAGYVLALPLLGVGVISVTVGMRLQKSFRGVEPENNFSASDIPAHPITEILARPDVWVRVQVALLACVMAPLVEEVMFRGLLYRHLREKTRWLGRVVSFVLSAAAVSFLFAAIHPQGLLAVPALMALAFAFALLREWRGSVVPAMIAHGINNGVVLALSLLTLPR